MIDEAKQYMARGWKVFPVDGKIPATRNGVKDASGEEYKADTWWGEHPTRGIALATGHTSGVWVLDIDGPDAADHMNGLQDLHGKLPETPASRTRNGWHLLFRMPETGDVRNSASKVAPGVDVRGTGGYIVLPPSSHPDGGNYRWIEHRDPDSCEIAKAPEWLLGVVRQPATGENKGPAPPMPEKIGSGARNQTLTSLAGSLRRRGASVDAIHAALKTENTNRCDPPLPDDEVRRIAESVGRYEPAEQPSGGAAAPGPEPAEPPEVEVVDIEVLGRIREEKLQPLSVVPTPWPTWNNVCRGAGGGEGLAHGWHVIIGASSGAGKSLMATNLAARAIRAGEDVCLISLEMSQSEVVTRLLSIYASEEVRQLEHGSQFRPGAWNRASEKLMEAAGSIRVNREPIRGLNDIALAVERYASEGCETIIIDYLQLAWVRDAETMVQQVTEVSHTVRGLAREYGVLSVGLSQVNRKMSFGGGDMKKEGLLGGSSLENDADQVLLLSKQRPEGEAGYKSTATLDKNRHGPQVEWDILLKTDTLQIREMKPDEMSSYALQDAS